MATAPETLTPAAEAPPAGITPAAPAEVKPASSYYDELERKPEDQPAPEADLVPAEGDLPEGEGEPEGELEPIAAPISWSKDYKEQFSQLPREMQEIVAKRESERESFLQQKSREAAQTRQTVESEALGVIQQLQRNYAEQMEAYAGQYHAEPPDIRLLQSQDPQHHALYYDQDRAYRTATAQREAIAQQVQQTRQQMEALEQQRQQQELQEEIQVLTEKVPEWSDPSARAKLLTDLEPIAAELGYSAEAIAQARAADIIALKQAHSWRADAMKYRELMKRRMEPVRAAKQVPPAARAGVPTPVASQPADVTRQLYPNDPPRN